MWVAGSVDSAAPLLITPMAMGIMDWIILIINHIERSLMGMIYGGGGGSGSSLSEPWLPVIADTRSTPKP